METTNHHLYRDGHEAEAVHSNQDVESFNSENKNVAGAQLDTFDAAQPGQLATDMRGKELIQFDPKEEARLRRKIDRWIVPTVALLYLFCFIDRANIGNARLAGLEKDLGINPKTYQYNVLLSSFYVSYIVFEIPSTMLTKIIGPKIWIATMAGLFGLLSMCTAFVSSYGAAIAVRFLLGVAEAGMLPSIAFYLSRFYKKDELALRLAMYIVMAPSAGAFGGLLASGILKIDRIGTIERWEMIFFVEGIITIGLAVIGYFTLTNSIESAKWLTEDEKYMATARLKTEMVGQTVLVDKANSKAVIRGIFAPTSIFCALMFLLDNITVQGVAFFLPTIVKTLYPKETVIHQQLLTVPPNVVGAVGVLLSAYITTKIRVRFPIVFVNALFMLTGYAMFLGSKNLNVRYAGSFVTCIGAFSMGALLPAWAAINTNNDSEKAGAIGVVVMFGNMGGLIATWSYLSKHAPNFVPGNSLNLGAGAGIALLSIVLYFYQKRENVKRERGDYDHRLQGKSMEEIELLGLNHPGFKLRH
jgi:MFS family permease